MSSIRTAAAATSVTAAVALTLGAQSATVPFAASASASAASPGACVRALDSTYQAGLAHWRHRNATVKPPGEERDSLRTVLALVRFANANACVARFATQTPAQSADTSSRTQWSRDMEALLRITRDSSVVERPFRFAAWLNKSQKHESVEQLMDDVKLLFPYGGQEEDPRLSAIGTVIANALDSVHASVDDRIKTRLLIASAASFPGRLTHLERARSLVREMTPAERASNTDVVGRTYWGLAAAYAWYGRTADALTMAREGADAMAASNQKSSDMGHLLDPFFLLAKTAPTLMADHWLNAADVAHPIDFTGKVTLLQFTGLSCTWCQEGYPTLMRLGDRYRGKPVQIILVTTLLTTLDPNNPSNPHAVSEALQEGRDHWIGQFGIPFPIAFVAASWDRQARQLHSQVLRDYAANATPTYFLIDELGTIRYVQVGHGGALESILTGVIDRVLAENHRQ